MIRTWLSRLLCTHEVYILVPNSPLWIRCAICGKTKRIAHN